MDPKAKGGGAVRAVSEGGGDVGAGFVDGTGGKVGAGEGGGGSKASDHEDNRSKVCGLVEGKLLLKRYVHFYQKRIFSLSGNTSILTLILLILCIPKAYVIRAGPIFLEQRRQAKQRSFQKC